MPLIESRYESIPGGRILYDAAQVRKADEELLDPAFWSLCGRARGVEGGRGSLARIRDPGRDWALRHYLRGGFVARWVHDRYWWSGEERTRSFREWRLLARLRELDLPVPSPVAARYVRSGWTYTADLITAWIPETVTLASALVRSTVEEPVWREIGQTIARFHLHGVHHADLNAHNILIAGEGAGSRIYILDFDRGRIRERGDWEQGVLARLRRSLDKVSSQAGQSFDERQWQWLEAGYASSAGTR